MAFNWLSLKKSNKSFRNNGRFFSPEILPLESRITPANNFAANLNLIGTPVANIVEVVVTSNGINSAANTLSFYNDSFGALKIDAGAGNTLTLTNNTSGSLSSTGTGQIVTIGLNSVQLSNLKIVGGMGQDQITLKDLNSPAFPLQTAADFGVQIDTATNSSGYPDTLTISGNVNLLAAGSFITSNQSPDRNLSSIQVLNGGQIINNTGSGIISLTANAQINSGITINNGGVLQTRDGQVLLQANDSALPQNSIALNGNAISTAGGAINFLSNVYLQSTTSLISQGDINFAKNIDGASGLVDLTLTTPGNITVTGDVGSYSPIGQISINGSPSSVSFLGKNGIVAGSLQALGVAGNITIAGPQNYTSLQQIQVTTPGSNYTTAPNVIITGGGGSDAAATSSLSVTGIQGNITGVSGSLSGVLGSVVGVSGNLDGINGTITGMVGGILGVQGYLIFAVPVNPGANYVVGDILTVTQGANSTARFSVTGINANGGITALQSLNNGPTFSSDNNYNISDPALSNFAMTGGSGTGATANVTGLMASTNIGTGYTNGSLVNIVDASGNITASATVVAGLNGQILRLSNVTPGTNYNILDLYNLTIFDPITGNSTARGNFIGQILNSGISSRGGGYTSGQLVTIQDPSGNIGANGILTVNTTTSGSPTVQGGLLSFVTIAGKVTIGGNNSGYNIFNLDGSSRYLLVGSATGANASIPATGQVFIQQDPNNLYGSLGFGYSIGETVTLDQGSTNEKSFATATVTAVGPGGSILALDNFNPGSLTDNGYNITSLNDYVSGSPGNPTVLTNPRLYVSIISNGSGRNAVLTGVGAIPLPSANGYLPGEIVTINDNFVTPTSVAQASIRLITGVTRQVFRLNNFTDVATKSTGQGDGYVITNNSLNNLPTTNQSGTASGLTLTLIPGSIVYPGSGGVAGTGYKVNDVITIKGGSAPATATVTQVDANGGIVLLDNVNTNNLGYDILNLGSLEISGGSGAKAYVGGYGTIDPTTGGMGYIKNDLLIIPGSTNPTILSVNSVGPNGEIVSVSSATPSKVNPALPSVYDISNISNVPVTSNTGSGATLDLIGTAYSTTTANLGTGYQENDVITFLGGDSTNLATGVVTRINSNGGIEDFTITNPGSGYSKLDPVIVSGGSGSGAFLFLYGNVTDVRLTNYGNGYTSPPAVNFIGGGGNSAQAVAKINTNNQLTLSTQNNGNITISGPVNMGINAPLNLTHSGTLTIGADIVHGIFNEQPASPGTPIVQMGVDAAISIFSDSGITFSSPVYLVQNTTLKTTGNNGITFNAGATLNGTRTLFLDTAGEITFLDDIGNEEVVNSIETINQNPFKFNFNKVSAPGKSLNAFSVNITTSGDVNITVDQNYYGSGLFVTTLGNNVVPNLNSPGDITLGLVNSGFGTNGGVTISNAGQLFLTENLNLDGSFTQASVVNGVIVTNGGSGYTTSPSVVFEGGNADSQATGLSTLRVNQLLQITSGGTLYIVGDVVTLVDIARNDASTYATAQVTGVGPNGEITGLSILTMGSGYTNLSGLSLVAGNGNSSALGNFSGQVSQVRLTGRGSGYRSNPTVRIITATGGTGSGAAANATLTSAQGVVHIGTLGSASNPFTITTNQQNVKFVSPVILNQDFSILTGQSGSANVDLAAVDSLTGNTFNLNIEARGNIGFNGSLGATSPLGNIDAARAVATNVISGTGASAINALSLKAIATNNIAILANQTYSITDNVNSVDALNLVNTLPGGSITLGKVDSSLGNGNIVLNNAGPLNLRSDIRSGGQISQLGNGQSRFGLSNTPLTITTIGKDILFYGDVKLLAATSLVTNGGAVTFNNLVDGSFDFLINAQNTIAPGNNGGNVTLGDRLGFDPLGKINITSANQVRILGSILAESLNISAATGPVVITGNARFIPGNTTSTSAKSLQIQTTTVSGSVVLQSNIDAPNGIEINNKGALTIPDAGDLTITNAGFDQIGAGSVSIAGDIRVLGGDIKFAGPVYLTGSSIFSASNSNDPSIITLGVATVNTVNDSITVPAASSFQTGVPVQLTIAPGGVLPTGLAVNRTYYLIRNSATTIQFATSATNAFAGTAINIGPNAGSGTMVIGVLPGNPAPVIFSSINFANQVNGFGNLALDATGTISFGSTVGALSPVGTLQINNSYKNALNGICTSFAGNLTTNKLNIVNSTGIIQFLGNATIQSQLLTSASNYDLNFLGASTNIGGDASFLNSGKVSLLGSTNFSGATSFSKAGSLELQGSLTSSGNMSIQRPVNITNALSMNLISPSNTISGRMTGAGAITLNGTNSKLILSADSPYNGLFTVNGGVNLQISSLFDASSVNIAGGTVSGNGRIFKVDGTTGTFAPGSSVGTLTVANSLDLSYAPLGKFTATINGASAGKYSQVSVQSGTTTLQNAVLDIPQANNLNVGQQVRIINNGNGVGLVGTFKDLPEGSKFTIGNSTVNTTFSISYQGGDGNDVVLTVTGVNSAASSIPIPGGDGIRKFFAVGTDYGGGPVVSLNFTNGHNIMFYAYSPNYRGGVRVTIGDVNGDGFDDLITGTGIGGGPHIKVWDIRGVSAGGIPVEIASFFAFEPNFMGGTNLATGDVNNDGFADIIVGAGAGGGPRVKVLGGATNFNINANAPIMDLFAYNPAFTGGVVVASGDRDGDAVADVITGAGVGGGPNVRSFNAAGILIDNFFAFSSSITNGIFIAAGNVDGDGLADIIAGTGFGTTTQIAAFYSGGTVARAVPFTSYFIGGARPGVFLNADGTQSFAVSAGPGGAPEVQVLNNSLGATDAFFAINPLFSGGLFLNTTL